jgi:hypothetical protein
MRLEGTKVNNRLVTAHEKNFRHVWKGHEPSPIDFASHKDDVLQSLQSVELRLFERRRWFQL